MNINPNITHPLIQGISSRVHHSGSVLLMTLGFITVLSLTIASVMSYAGTETVMVSRRSSQIDALYGAEAATRRSLAQIKALYFSNYSTNSYLTGNYAAPTDIQLNNLSSPGSVSALGSAYSYSSTSNYFITGTSANRYTNVVIAANDPALSQYSGLTSSRATIACQAEAISLSARITNVTMRVRQAFNIDYIPVFQYAVFYNMDMEIFNGPTMTINGKVHSNGTLYYAPADTLKITDNLSAAGDIERGLKKWDSSKPTSFASLSAAAQTAYRDAEFPPGTINQATGIAYTDSERTTLAQNRWPIDPDNFVSSPPTSGSYGTASFNVKNASSGSQVDFRTGTSPLTYFDSESAGWAGGATTKWAGGVKSQAQGATNIPPPIPADVQASATDPNNPYHSMIERPNLDVNGASTDSLTLQSAKMAYKASLMIKRTGASGTTTAGSVEFYLRGTDGNFHKVTNLRNASNIVPSTVTTLHDQREYLQNGGKEMRITEFDIAQLYGSGSSTAGATDASGNFMNTSNTAITTDAFGNSFTPVGFDGTVYIYDDNYGSSDKPGIRIKNGGTIYDKDNTADSSQGDNGNIGLTVISENPVYVQGNFNADGSTSTGPEKTGGSKENVPPAAIVADSVSVLSNKWKSSYDDPGGSGSFNASTYGGRSGTSSEINAAILAGVNQSDQSTNPDTFNGTTGGLNNFPKFLENWSGTFKYSGSMVALWYSTQSSGQYRGAGTSEGVFSAPTRDWAFNTDFLNVNRLPRMTPIIRVYSTADWQNY